MKFRLEDNSLRLRLSAAEVRTFAATGRVAAATHFGPDSGQQLSYALERVSPGSAAVLAPQPSVPEPVCLRYAPGQLVVLVPALLADDWTNTDRNGFSAEISVFANNKLRILVEKDLDCRH